MSPSNVFVYDFNKYPIKTSSLPNVTSRPTTPDGVLKLLSTTNSN